MWHKDDVLKPQPLWWTSLRVLSIATRRTIIIIHELLENQEQSNILIGSKCPGISRTVLDLEALSLVPEALYCLSRIIQILAIQLPPSYHQNSLWQNLAECQGAASFYSLPAARGHVQHQSTLFQFVVLSAATVYSICNLEWCNYN